MKNCFVRFVAVMAVALVGLMVPVCDARAGGDDNVVFVGGYTLDGFTVGYSGVQDSEGEQAGVGLHIQSHYHRITQATTSFSTFISNPSDGRGEISISGFKNTATHSISSGFYSAFDNGQVSLLQSSGFYYGGGGANVGYGNIWIAPFTLYGGSVSYLEFLNPDGVRVFFFTLTFNGTFGDGPEGDRLGAPFVPTPGTAALLGLAGFATIRRRRTVA